jgi:hypothetical protein
MSSCRAALQRHKVVVKGGTRKGIRYNNRLERHGKKNVCAQYETETGVGVDKRRCASRQHQNCWYT